MNADQLLDNYNELQKVQLRNNLKTFTLKELKKESVKMKADKFAVTRMKRNQISSGNRTEWSPIRSVIIRVINKIARPRSGSPISSITSMITDPIGRHEVLLPINHNLNKIYDI